MYTQYDLLMITITLTKWEQL